MIYRTSAIFGILAFLVFSSMHVTAMFAPEWVLQSEKDGIKIYTKDVDGAKYKQVRGMAEIQVPKEQVIRILTEFNNYHLWNDHITASYKVNSLDDTTHLVYTMEDAPWPVQDRYHVSKFTVSESPFACTISFESVPDFFEKRPDAIELKRQRGFWKITSQEEGGCLVEFFMDRHPGGYIPVWLVNYMVVETPFKTLQNLRGIIERQPRP